MAVGKRAEFGIRSSGLSGLGVVKNCASKSQIGLYCLAPRHGLRHIRA